MHLCMYLSLLNILFQIFIKIKEEEYCVQSLLWNKIKFSLYVLAFLNYNFTFVALLIQYSRINLPHVSFYACLLSATFSPLL